jgi:dipeptidyl-peptidase-3
MAYKKKAIKPKRIYELERICNARTVQLYADGFDSLAKKEKIFAYYMAEAAIAGREIAIDQTNRYAVDIMSLCEKIISNPKRVPARTMKSIQEYIKLFWVNNGMYDYATAKKFVPACTPKEFEKALATAEKNDGVSGGESGSCVEKLKEIKQVMFDPNYMPVVTDKTPGHDYIVQSANNFYEGVTTSQVEEWSKSGSERNPLNSKVVADGGKIRELVWRAGGKGVGPGMYSKELNAVVENLGKAREFAANEHQAHTINLLIRYFQTGDPADWERFNVDWVKDSSNVDFILGFIEVYMDPRGQKGRFESVVYFTDKEQTELMRKLAGSAQYFEDHVPWNNEYKKKGVAAPIAKAVNAIVETGDAGPISAIGINLPNEQKTRQTYGSKSVMLHNVIAAYNASEPKGLLKEFCYDRNEIKRAKKYGRFADDMLTALHEVLGHGSGKVSDTLLGDPADHLPGYYSTLEEARADLVALWNVFDPKLKQLKIIDSDDVGKAMYDAYIRGVFLQLRRITVGNQLEEDHMKNRQMVTNYIIRNSDAIKTEKRRNKTYFKITNYQAMHDAVGRLLAEVMRIKAEGDLAAGKALVDTYGLKINTAWRDEVLKRVKKLNISAYTGFVMPSLHPIKSKSGKIVDVKVSYPLSLTDQMLEYSRTGQQKSGRNL